MCVGICCKKWREVVKNKYYNRNRSSYLFRNPICVDVMNVSAIFLFILGVNKKQLLWYKIWQFHVTMPQLSTPLPHVSYQIIHNTANVKSLCVTWIVNLIEKIIVSCHLSPSQNSFHIIALVAIALPAESEWRKRFGR